MIIVSPGVYARERDFSLYVPTLATSIYGIVTSASKGPLNQVTLITDESSLIRTFGPPSLEHLGLYAAQRYLRFGRQLKVVRVSTYAVAAGDLTFAKTADGTLVFSIPDDVGPGSWANGLQVKIEDGTDDGTFKVSIIDEDGYTLEPYDLLLIGSDNAADPNYIETRMAGSLYVSVDDTGTGTDIAGSTQTFADGDDGAPADDSDIIGVVGSPPVVPATGLQLFANPETVDVNMVGVPGHTEDSIRAAIQTLCVARGDCFGLIDIPSGKNVQQAVAWTNGTGGGADDPTAAINSSYLACYYPWLTVYDSYSDSEVEIPPQGHVAGVLAYTDYVADPWWAGAGLNRALLVDVLSIEHSAAQGERDYMYGGNNVVNPIINYVGQGFVVWGNKTMSRASTALNRLNVRRLLLYMRKVIATAVRYLVFEPNDEITWQRFVNLVTPICRAIKSRRGLYDFRVICDETTNTPDRLNNNEMYGRILLQPTKTAEMIQIDFTLLPSGASFEEFS